VGEWVENIGVRAAKVPEALSVLAVAEGFWLPEPPIEGWSWVTLDEMLGDSDFDDLIESVARDTAAPALGYGVFDGDCAYLAVASPNGIEGRLVFDHEAYDAMYEGQFPPAAKTARGGAKAFAAWSSAFAPVGVSVGAVRRFCEEPDPLRLLVAVGLYPPPKPSRRPAWEDWYPTDMHGAGPRWWDGGGHSYLDGPREFATLAEPAGQSDGPPGPWILFVARDTGVRRSAPVEACLTFTTKDTCYSLHGEFATIDDAKRHFGATYEGRTIGEWKQIPESVGRDRAETIAWLLEASVDGDWRLTGHHEDLHGASLVRTDYRTGAKWLKDHCRFCSAPFVDPTASEELAQFARNDARVQTSGYTPLRSGPQDYDDQADWICAQCFDDFHEHFNWSLAEQR
jgi:hypothetical protein